MTLAAVTAAMAGRLGIMALERLALKESKLIKHKLQALDIDLTRLIQVAAWVDEEKVDVRVSAAEHQTASEAIKGRTGAREDTLVDAPDELHRALIDVNIGQMGQEIVADKDRDEDEVVDNFLE